MYCHQYIFLILSNLQSLIQIQRRFVILCYLYFTHIKRASDGQCFYRLYFGDTRHIRVTESTTDAMKIYRWINVITKLFWIFCDWNDVRTFYDNRHEYSNRHRLHQKLISFLNRPLIGTFTVESSLQMNLIFIL